MSPRLRRLAERRETLVSLAALQRVELVDAAAGLATGNSLGRTVKAHPVWAGAAAIVCGILLARRGRLVIWAGRALVLWRGWQTVQVWLRSRPAAPR